MALTPAKRENFTKYMRVFGALKNLRESPENFEYFKNLSFEEQQFLLCLFYSRTIEKDFGDFLDTMNDKNSSDYVEIKNAYGEETTNQIGEFMLFFASDTPDSKIFKIFAAQKAAQEQQQQQQQQQTYGSYSPAKIEKITEHVGEFAAGFVAGMAVRAAFSAAAISLLGPTFVGAVALGAFTGAVVGTGFGVYYSYKNLSYNRVQDVGLGGALWRDKKAIAKGAAIGAAFGAVGSAAFMMLFGGGVESSVAAANNTQTTPPAASTPVATPTVAPTTTYTPPCPDYHTTSGFNSWHSWNDGYNHGYHTTPVNHPTGHVYAHFGCDGRVSIHILEPGQHIYTDGSCNSGYWGDQPCRPYGNGHCCSGGKIVQIS